MSLNAVDDMKGEINLKVIQHCLGNFHTLCSLSIQEKRHVRKGSGGKQEKRERVGGERK